MDTTPVYTSGVGSALPPAKWHPRSQSTTHTTNQSSEDLVVSPLQMTQDTPTIVHAILDASPI